MGIRVLLIEDEPQLADFVVRGLREEAFTVEHRADGSAGWEALRTGTWDVVLMDWWLPAHDGLSLLRRYRAEAGTAPVLFLTARDAVPDRVQALNAGADDYLSKPFAFEELLARIHALTRRQPHVADLQLHYAGVTVHLGTHRVERAGARLNLTAKEYAVLVYFLRHPEQVLSRTRIYEQVWEECYDGTSNTLEVLLVELRRKLEAHGPRLVHTHRHRGYSLGAAGEHDENCTP